MSLNKRVHHGWMVLFKFGAYQHLDEFRKTGLLFMNSSTYFSDLEHHVQVLTKEDPVRADRFEGTDCIFHPKEHTILIQGPASIDGKLRNIEIPIFANDMADHTSLIFDKNSCNIYCMYAIIEPQAIDERNFQFGDSFVIVLNTAEFLRRFSTAADELGLQWQCGLVDYYELDKYSGVTGPFRKPSRFAYQSEFRLAVRPGVILRRITIGNIEDITSEILPLREINKRFDCSPDAARKAGLSW